MADNLTSLKTELDVSNNYSDSDEESFVVLEQESLNVNSLNVGVIEESLSLISEQTAITNSLTPETNDTAAANSGIDDIQARVVELLEENNKLKETLTQNNAAIKRQMDIICTWQLEMQQVHQSHKEKFAETKLYIDKLKKENATLKEALKESESEVILLKEEIQKYKMNDGSNLSGGVSLLRQDYDNLTELELQASQKKICDLESALKSMELSHQQNVHVQQLTHHLAECNFEKDKLSQELEKLKEDYEKKQEEFWENIELLKKRQAENAKNENFQEVLQNLRQQLMHAQETITELSDERHTLQYSLKEKIEEYKELEQKYAEMSIELDTISVLKMQLDVYKTDFEAEKNSVNILKAEKEKLVEDLNLIQRRNQQLLKEIEKVRGPSVVRNMSNSRESSTSSTPPLSASAPQEDFACPRCGFRFYNLTALENHVYRCIELDSLP